MKKKKKKHGTLKRGCHAFVNNGPICTGTCYFLYLCTSNIEYYNTGVWQVYKSLTVQYVIRTQSNVSVKKLQKLLLKI